MTADAPAIGGISLGALMVIYGAVEAVKFMGIPGIMRKIIFGRGSSLTSDEQRRFETIRSCAEPVQKAKSAK
jgi:hypothetical protein